MHDRIGFAPVPEGFDFEPLVEFAAAFVKVFNSGAEQGLAESTRAGEEEIFSGIKQVKQPQGLVHIKIVHALFAEYREVADPKRESG
jgi:hypothetical protein